MTYDLLIFSAVCLLPVLLYFENREHRNGMLPAKTGMSLLFVAAVVIQPHPIPAYYRFLLVGLVLCLIGDICLVFQHPIFFLAGLIAFLLGHVLYFFGFMHVTPIKASFWLGAIAVLTAGIWIFRWLKPHLGSMKVPVLIYTVVISAMLAGAWSLLCDSHLTVTGRMAAFFGAFCFYISDIFVARDRFIKKEFLNRLAGLPLYYAGQFLIAFSVGLLKTI